MDQTNTDYIFHNETIRLSVIFLAKPKPEPQDINWNVFDGNVIEIAHPDEVSNEIHPYFYHILYAARSDDYKKFLENFHLCDNQFIVPYCNFF